MALALFLSVPSWSQYTGPQAQKKDTTDLRAVAVLEWTGEPGKPKACRIVPVSIYDGDRLQDAGIYLARPQPLALTAETEYQLKQNGKTIGLFDITGAGHEQGSWVGFGDWKPAPQPKSALAAPVPIEDFGDDDKPVLHRKHRSDDKSGNSGSSTTASNTDSDRPKLHKKDDAGETSASGPASDSDRPTLHKHPAADSDSSASAPPDPDRPALKKPKSKAPEDVGHVDPVRGVTDPDRPHLIPGKPTGTGPVVLPTLMGLPPDMQQAVAVSDVRDRPDHPWSYSWANPDDQAKMKSNLEDIARAALGLDQPAPAPVPKPARPAAAGRKAVEPPPPPPEPLPLRDEAFRVFELAYGSGATMVFSADTGGPLAQEKFITLIAQPDLYGDVLVLYKSVADGAHLEETPRMRLVDAVDALGDNRGELLFELRSQTSRQFALFRVLRGSAERIFVTSAENFGSMDE